MDEMNPNNVGCVPETSRIVESRSGVSNSEIYLYVLNAFFAILRFLSVNMFTAGTNLLSTKLISRDDTPLQSQSVAGWGYSQTAGCIQICLASQFPKYVPNRKLFKMRAVGYNSGHVTRLVQEISYFYNFFPIDE
jgi:hypothetical protein